MLGRVALTNCAIAFLIKKVRPVDVITMTGGGPVFFNRKMLKQMGIRDDSEIKDSLCECLLCVWSVDLPCLLDIGAVSKVVFRGRGNC